MNRQSPRGRSQDRAAIMPIRQPSCSKIMPMSHSFPGSDHSMSKIYDFDPNFPPKIGFNQVRPSCPMGIHSRSTLEKKDTADIPKSPRFQQSVRFSMQSSLIEILNLDDYSKEEFQAYWYTKKELRDIRKEISSDNMLNDEPSCSSDDDPSCKNRRWSA